MNPWPSNPVPADVASGPLHRVQLEFDSDLPLPVSVCLEFQNLGLEIRVRGEDDTVEVRQPRPRAAVARPSPEPGSPWRDAHGLSLTEFWLLQNRLGAVDGVQLGFRGRRESNTELTIQVLAIASQLETYITTPVQVIVDS